MYTQRTGCHATQQLLPRKTACAKGCQLCARPIAAHNLACNSMPAPHNTESPVHEQAGFSCTHAPSPTLPGPTPTSARPGRPPQLASTSLLDFWLLSCCIVRQTSPQPHVLHTRWQVYDPSALWALQRPSGRPMNARQQLPWRSVCRAAHALT